MRPLISVAATKGLLEAIRTAGADPDTILRTLEFDGSVLSDAERFIPCSVFARILEEAARVSGDHCFGLHFGERFNPKNIGPLAYVVLNSPTIAVADEQVARYLKLYNQAAKASCTVDGERTYLQRIFGAPVLFGYQTNNLVIESEFLTRHVPAADPRLYRIIKRYLERILKEMPEDPGVLASVRRAIAESMRDGDPNLARVAKKWPLAPAPCRGK